MRAIPGKKATEWPACWSSLEGPGQTTPRAELAAFAWACQHAEGHLTVYTDHKALVDVFYSALATAHNQLHGDLWQQVQQAMASGLVKIDIVWVNSHPEADEDFQPRLPDLVYLGNDKADQSAGLGAKAHEVDDYSAKQWEDSSRAVRPHPVPISGIY